METTLKTCFKCLLEKSLESFYKHSGTKDGHLNKCKDCTRADVSKHRLLNDSVREYDRKRGNRQPKGYVKQYRERFPNKYKAHIKLNNSLRDGHIRRGEECERCGVVGGLEAHHDDYLSPLEVRWLCSRCHSLHHAEFGEGLNAK